MSKLLAFSVVTAVSCAFAVNRYEHSVEQVKRHIASEATKYKREPDSHKLKTATAICSTKYGNDGNMGQQYCEALFLQNYYAFMSNAKLSSEPPKGVNPDLTTRMFVKAALVKRGIIEDEDDDDDESW